jgi:hypothetical protein
MHGHRFRVEAVVQEARCALSQVGRKGESVSAKALPGEQLGSVSVLKCKWRI